MNKWAKRVFKLQGFMNYCYSLVLLRYSAFNTQRLKKYFQQHPVDKLHIGCGLLHLKGWCNVLYEPNQEYGKVHELEGYSLLNYNLLKPWPWAKESVSYVAAAHFIEHLDLNHGLKFVQQAYNVLKPGGVCRLSCPDLETYAKNYIEGNMKFFAHPEIVKGCTFKNAQTPSQIFAAKAYDSGGAHKWFHDYSSLKNMFERAGFINVRKVGRLEGQTPDLDTLELSNRITETVYVEAYKPVKKS